MILKRKGIIFIIVAVIISFILGLYAKNYLNSSNSNSKTEDTVVKDFTEYNVISHAMGEIEGNFYSNSKEAFLCNYEKGARVFEVDLIETSDGHIVARHDWNNKLYEMLSQENISEGESKPLTYEQFKSLKIHNKFTPIDFEEILDLMCEYEDIYIVTDTKSGYSEDAQRVFGKIIALINEKDPKLIDRIVPQIYSQAMYPTLKELHEFENVLYTLYMDLSTDEEVLKFVIDNDITGVVMSESRYNKDFVKSLNENNIKTYVHTINDVETASNYIKEGIFGVYTDYPEIKDKINK